MDELGGEKKSFFFKMQNENLSYNHHLQAHSTAYHHTHCQQSRLIQTTKQHTLIFISGSPKTLSRERERGTDDTSSAHNRKRVCTCRYSGKDISGHHYVCVVCVCV